MELNNATAIVTGAASGLGAATAAALAQRGVSVFGFDLPDVISTAPEVTGVTYLPVDVTDAQAVMQAVDVAAANCCPLRVVVNCAGIAPSMRVLGKAGSHAHVLFAHVIQVNLLGTFNVLTSAAARMAGNVPQQDGQRGVIINTASVAAYEGQIGQAAYAASKGGIVSLTLPAARDLAEHGIRVLAIAPGVMDTPMLATVSEGFRSSLASNVPFPRRLGLPEEYAQLAVALVDNSYMNGEVVRMDGGLRMTPR